MIIRSQEQVITPNVNEHNTNLSIVNNNSNNNNNNNNNNNLIINIIIT